MALADETGLMQPERVDLVVIGHVEPGMLTERLAHPGFTGVLGATPGGELLELTGADDGDLVALLGEPDDELPPDPRQLVASRVSGW